MNTGISTGPNSVYVEWDTCMRFPYHFETSANSKVVVCNEPRILLRERIAVGCLVERGKYFFLCHINWLPNLCDVNCSYSPIYNDFIYSFQLSFLLSFIIISVSLFYQVKTGSGLIRTVGRGPWGLCIESKRTRQST